jgi:hypothetical protein
MSKTTTTEVTHTVPAILLAYAVAQRITLKSSRAI